MKDYLKQYKIKITARSPIHIGNGKQIGKKDYAYLPDSKFIVVIDISKLYAALININRSNSFEDFYLNTNKDLGSWLKKEGFSDTQIIRMGRYILETEDIYIKKDKNGRALPQNVVEFVKDGCGRPYIPGSSLKGMLRTALLCYDINKSGDIDTIRRTIDSGLMSDAKKKSLLRRETSNIEKEAFSIKVYDEKLHTNVDVSKLSGLIVSDSSPLTCSDLILSQKVDLDLSGREHYLPIYRESIKPGTEITFDLTLNKEIFPYSIEDIFEGLTKVNDIAYKYFYSRFKRGERSEDTVWIGGGVGFHVKTILYSIYGQEGAQKADKVFEKTLGKNYYTHKHPMYRRTGVSPHVCKCTRYNGKLYDMGMGKIELIG